MNYFSIFAARSQKLRTLSRVEALLVSMPTEASALRRLEHPDLVGRVAGRIVLGANKNINDCFFSQDP